MFSNEVSYEARGFTPDGIEIMVTEKAYAESEISYEDAWLKAHALANEKAEAKLAECLKKLSEEVKDKLVLLKGERGCPGSRGPRGPAGAAGGAYQEFSGIFTADQYEQIKSLFTIPTSNTNICSVKVQDVISFYKLYQSFYSELFQLFEIINNDTASINEYGNIRYNLTGPSLLLLFNFLIQCIDNFSTDGIRSLIECGFIIIKKQSTSNSSQMRNMTDEPAVILIPGLGGFIGPPPPPPPLL